MTRTEELRSKRAETASILPTVTLAMLVDILSRFDVAQRPKRLDRAFRWFAVELDEGNVTTSPEDVPDANMLQICRAEHAQRVLEDSASTFVLVAIGMNDSMPSAIAEHPDRVLAIRTEEPLTLVAFRIQTFFTKLLLWEAELDRIAARGGSLTELIDASATVLENFVFVSDVNFNVVAYSSTIKPPDELHQRIVETGCLTTRMIEERRERLAERTFYAREPSGISEYARLSYPLHINHMYYGSVSMSCHAKPVTEGLKDLFTVFIRHASHVYEQLWRNQIKQNTPQFFFLTSLLDGPRPSDEYIRAQMAIARIPPQSEYKLVIANADETQHPNKAAKVVTALSRMNHGAAFSFAYRDVVVAVLYALPSDNRLSHRKSIDEYDSLVYGPHGIIGATSSIFEDITDLPYALRQARIALAMRDAILHEQIASDGSPAKGLFLFEDAILYYLVDPGSYDKGFVDFTFSHTVVGKLYREDRENGTNYLSLFWFYLISERNATDVASRLHMHRNTVLYHIDKIQKRFDFDLSHKPARDRMLIDFKHLFRTTESAEAEKLILSAFTGERD